MKRSLPLLLAAVLVASECMAPDFAPAVESVSAPALQARMADAASRVKSLNFTGDLTMTITPRSPPGAASGGTSPVVLRNSARGTVDNATGAFFRTERATGADGTTRETAEGLLGEFNYTRDASGAWSKERVTPAERREAVDRANPLNFTARLFAVSALTWNGTGTWGAGTSISSTWSPTGTNCST